MDAGQAGKVTRQESRIRREEDVTVGISCKRPDQDEEVDGVIFAF